MLRFGTHFAIYYSAIKKIRIMKQAITSVIVLAISIIIWLHWGGLSNDMGTLIIALADVFALTVITDKTPEKVEKK
jgi:F0F1-type ATP synthase assembly protein I